MKEKRNFAVFTRHLSRSETKNNARQILMLAAPIIIEQLLQTFLGTTDTYFAGTLADEAIAGISVTNLIVNLLLSFFTAVSVGAAATISRCYGRKDFVSLCRFIRHSLVLGAGMGLTAGILCALCSVPILRLSRADAASLAFALPYYRIVAVPCVILSLQLILSSCLRAMKDTKTPMYITGASNLLNIVLNLLLLKLGTGIAGLGLATTLSRSVSVLLLLLRLKGRCQKLPAFCITDAFCLRPAAGCFTRSEFAAILKIGVPAGIEKFVMRIGQLLYNGMILSIDTTSYVAHNIAGAIESYSYIPAMGIGLAVCTIVGVSLGENNIPKAKKQTVLAYRMTAGLMMFIGLFFFFFAPQLAAVFTNTRAVQQDVAAVLRIIAFFQPFSALVQIMTHALQGAGDTKYPMAATFLGIWGIRIVIGFLLAVSCSLGLSGVWYAYALDVTVRGLLLYRRFRQGKWQKVAL